MPKPVKKLWVKKPIPNCWGGQFVGNKGPIWLHGRVVGRIQNPQQAYGHPQRTAKGESKQTQAAKDSPNQKIGFATPPARVPGFVAHGPDNGLNEQARHRPGQIEQGQLFRVGIQKGVDGVNSGLLQSKTVLDAKKAHVHVDDLPKAQHRAVCRNLHAEKTRIVRIKKCAARILRNNEFRPISA